jgi:hypothetical protein
MHLESTHFAYSPISLSLKQIYALKFEIVEELV